MPHGIHTKRTPMAAEHTASRYQNDKLMQYQIGKKVSGIHPRYYKEGRRQTPSRIPLYSY
jgi:hypothetical protein